MTKNRTYSIVVDDALTELRTAENRAARLREELAVEEAQIEWLNTFLDNLPITD